MNKKTKIYPVFDSFTSLKKCWPDGGDIEMSLKAFGSCTAPSSSISLQIYSLLSGSIHR